MPVLTVAGTSRPLVLKVGGVNLSNHAALNLGPCRISESMGSPAQMEFLLDDRGSTLPLRHMHGQIVTLAFSNSVAGVAGFRLFGGHLIATAESHIGRGRQIACRAIGFDTWLDRRIVLNYSSRTNVNGRIRQVVRDSNIVKQLLSQAGGLVHSSAFIDETNAAMDVVTVKRASLRDALETVADVATVIAPESTRDFYVDHHARLHYFSGTENLAAPYLIADGSYTEDVMGAGTLVEMWPFRENAGTVAFGAKGVANATLNGGFTLGRTSVGVVNEPNSTAVKLNGTTGYASASGASLHPGDTFTIECWFRRLAFGTTQTLISGGSGDYQLGFDTNNKVHAYREGVGDHFISDTAVTGTGWHHLAWTRSPGSTDVYMDGTALTGTTTARTFAAAAGAVNIGRKLSTTNEFWNGDVQDVAIYAGKLGSALVLAHYRQGISLSVEGLTAEFDSGDVVHRVYINGANAAGSGWVDPPGGNWAGKDTQDFWEVRDSTTRAKRNAYGKAFVRQNKRFDSYHFSTIGYNGWALGQAVSITDDVLALSGPQVITELDTDVGLDNGVIRYDMTLGDPRASQFRRGRRRRRRRQ